MTDSQDDTKYIVRIICAVSTVISNVYLLLFISRKLWRGDKTLNNIFVFCISYIILTFIATLYNTLYRFILAPAACQTSDIFEESLISISRSVILQFYVIMIYEIFDKSKSVSGHGIDHTVSIHTKPYWKQMYVDNKLIFYSMIFIIVFHLIILPALYISYMRTIPIKTNYGIYCQNTWPSQDLWSVILYQLVDCVITIFLCILFVYKLHKLRQILKHWTDIQTDDTDVDRTKQKKLYRLARKAMILSFISIVSSWIVIASGRLDTSGNIHLRWFYPLDYMINCWCLFLIFEWQEFQCCCLKTVTDHNQSAESGHDNSRQMMERVHTITTDHTVNVSDDDNRSHTDSRL